MARVSGLKTAALRPRRPTSTAAEMRSGKKRPAALLQGCHFEGFLESKTHQSTLLVCGRILPKDKKISKYKKKSRKSPPGAFLTTLARDHSFGHLRQSPSFLEHWQRFVRLPHLRGVICTMDGLQKLREKNSISHQKTLENLYKITGKKVV